jgi:hypothetical protein
LRCHPRFKSIVGSRGIVAGIATMTPPPLEEDSEEDQPDSPAKESWHHQVRDDVVVGIIVLKKSPERTRTPVRTVRMMVITQPA